MAKTTKKKLTSMTQKQLTNYILKNCIVDDAGNKLKNAISFNADDSVDVDGCVDLMDLNLTELPFKFHKISGWFRAYGNSFTSFNNIPKLKNVGCAGRHQGYSFEIDPSIKINLQDVVDYFIEGDVSYNTDGTIDVNGSVLLGGAKLIEIPIKFNKVSGDFYCGSNKLTSLKNVPKFVGGNFDCSHNNLKNLEYAPEYVGQRFNCCDNELETLEGAPNFVGNQFSCLNNKYPHRQLWKTVKRTYLD